MRHRLGVSASRLLPGAPAAAYKFNGSPLAGAAFWPDRPVEQARARVTQQRADAEQWPSQGSTGNGDGDGDVLRLCSSRASIHACPLPPR